ncbi:glycosyltransferase [Halovulum sp. GXIMD14793]
MTAPRVVVMGYDVTEASQIRTIRWLQSAGCEVQSFCFRRDNMNAGFQPDWPDICLGQQHNHRLWQRVLHLPRAAWVLYQHRAAIRRADVIVARNLDLTLLALFARMVSRSRARVIYQCLDIHGIFTRHGWAGRLARWTERRALARIDRLVVSSPGFLRSYFGAVQGFNGDVCLVENGVFWPATPTPRPAPTPRAPGPLRLGWVGTLRCPATLKLLAAAAGQLGAAIEVHLHGAVHRHVLPDFDDVIGGCPNIHYHGLYRYPEGLATAYEHLDLVWAQDLWQRGANSDWLLPNRVYEAGYFGVPGLAVAGTETARFLDGQGFVIEAATPEALINWLHSVDLAVIAAARTRLLSRPAEQFCLSAEDALTMLDFAQSQGSANAALA